MKIDKKSLFIVLVSFSFFLIIRNEDNPMIKLKIAEVASLMIAISYVIKDSFFNLKELKDPSDEKIPNFFISAQNPKSKISVWFLSLFFLLMGFYNLKDKFLGYPEILPGSFQYPFSLVIITLGILCLFLAMIKTSKKFRDFIIGKYKFFSKIIFYFFILFFIFWVISMIAPFIPRWN